MNGMNRKAANAAADADRAHAAWPAAATAPATCATTRLSATSRCAVSTHVGGRAARWNSDEPCAAL